MSLDLEEKSDICYTIIPVLEFLNGRPWNNMAFNILKAVRPSCIEIINLGDCETLDCMNWRVRVYLNKSGSISNITQEVSCGCIGVRNGQDISNYILKNDKALDTPQGTCFINPRGISDVKITK